MLRLLILLSLLWSQVSLAAIITGNQKGNVTLDIIFDYQCPHCHVMYPEIISLQHTNPQLKVRWLPVAIINNPLSLEQATTAIAATKLPNGFSSFTDIIMGSPILTEPQFNLLLSNINLNNKNFLDTRHASWVESVLNEGTQLLHQYQIEAVPLIRIYPTTSPNQAKIFVGEQPLSILTGAINEII